MQNMAEYYAKLYAKTFDEYSSYIEYYRQYFTQEVIDLQSLSCEKLLHCRIFLFYNYFAF